MRENMGDEDAEIKHSDAPVNAKDHPPTPREAQVSARGAAAQPIPVVPRFRPRPGSQNATETATHQPLPGRVPLIGGKNRSK